MSDGFYEWKKEKEKIPFRILKKDSSLFAMAGLWDTWKDAEGRETQSFTIITTSANDLIKDIHHRMPVILHPEQEKFWLGEYDAQKHLELLKPFPSDLMKTYKISNLVNSPVNDTADVIKPQ